MVYFKVRELLTNSTGATLAITTRFLIAPVAVDFQSELDTPGMVGLPLSCFRITSSSPSTLCSFCVLFLNVDFTSICNDNYHLHVLQLALSGLEGSLPARYLSSAGSWTGRYRYSKN